ncbi:MAG TPA: 4Fe-4S dicluster domain-containing protein [Dehalococcoidales bacterium]|nr:4Fe-4S dicluster domain-containing protein [Dehalococcoidales bacterium]
MNNNNEKEISRRDFIRASGIGVGGLLLLGMIEPEAVLAETPAEKAILYDATKCLYCHTCEMFCKQSNELEGEIDVDGDLSPNTWLIIDRMEYGPEVGGIQPGWLFIRSACMHCGTCASVCPSGAIIKLDNGSIAVEQDKCIGCHYCHQACPLDIPRYGEDGTMRKCDFCQDRLALGEKPACVGACPANALIFGDRDEMVVEGRERVQALIAEGYSDAYLYGDKELGGMPVMYVLAYSPEEYGLPLMPKATETQMTWRDLIKPLGGMLGGLAVLGVGAKYVKAKKAK